MKRFPIRKGIVQDVYKKEFLSGSQAACKFPFELAHYRQQIADDRDDHNGMVSRSWSEYVKNQV